MQAMIYRFLADAVVFLHLGFILFALLGGLLLLWSKRAAWFHVPAVIWAMVVEYGGWLCPLTPLENWLRQKGGETGYPAGFVSHYLVPLIYPSWLTREIQIVLGTLVLLLNVWIYRRVLKTKTDETAAAESPGRRRKGEPHE